ncbi:MAG: hypothetical protein OEZ02_00130 [Anaerolineae bacterium]|nr:hypothetical protein [Anaerolineae bacterium]
MDNLTWVEFLYLTSAIIGGVLFLLRAIMFFGAGEIFSGDADGHIDGDIGGDFDGDFEGDVHGDLHGHMDGDHGSTDYSFKFLSMQGLTAFFMMFGLVGMALVQAGWQVIFTMLGGTAAGLFTVWVISRIFVGMKMLQSDGTVRMVNAIGQKGTVYLTIPASGTGQVRVAVQGALKIFDAVSANKKKIPTGENIQVIEVIANNILVVEKI